MTEFENISAVGKANALREPETFAHPATVIAVLEKNGIAPSEIDKIIGPRDELLQLVNEHADLTKEQSDRATRLASVVALAEKVFGRREKAFMWLRLPNIELEGRQPLECLVREPTSRAVEEALFRIYHGIAA